MSAGDNPQQAPPGQTVVVQSRGSALGWLGKLALVALGVCVLMIIGLVAQYQQYFGDGSGPQERYHSLSKTASQKIAVISVEGAILEGDTFVKKQIERVRDDKNVVAVVLRVNSPGGTVTQSDYLLHHLRELRDERELPLVVSMGSVCASGGYYVAMAVGDQEQAVFAEPTTWTGSIGVIIPHYDLSGLLADWSVEDDSIASGPLKDMGSLTKPMTERERELFQQLVDESYQGFREVVESGRPAFRDDEQALDAVATGQIFTADQALENGLVDKIGFIEAAIERAAELAGVSTDSVRCVEYKKPATLTDALMGAHAPAEPAGAAQARALLQLGAPRPYYLYAPVATLLKAAR